MNAQRFQELHARLTQKARDLCARKQKDYAGEEDIFSNLRLCADLGLCPADIGILVRMSDKLSRLGNLLKQPAAVEEETLEDTIVDLINYSILLWALFGDTAGKDTHSPASIYPRSTYPAEVQRMIDDS